MKVLITGGAGFIGVNTALAHAMSGDDVVVMDNLSRRGSEINAKLLRAARGVTFERGDVRDYNSVKKIFAAHRRTSLLYHFAAQVAVTSSVENPREDFQTNALGTLNVLEAARLLKMKAPIFFASTNKVYGGMEKEKFVRRRSGWASARFPRGIAESYPADFHSPYGCSKGAADQYVRDYARIYGMKTVVFRQSCIYGINQFGVEDQGWIAHFAIKALTGGGITIYGDGFQVRDALYVDDLIRLYRLAHRNINKVSGEIFNAGGGASNAISINGFVKLLEKKLKIAVNVKYSDWRPGDQKVFVSDNSKAERLLGWSPRFNVDKGLEKVIDWSRENRRIIINALSRR